MRPRRICAARILAALEAAQAEGGDARGQQSAALLVVDGERSDAPGSTSSSTSASTTILSRSRSCAASSTTHARSGSCTGVFEGGLLFAPAIDASMHAALEDALADLDAAQAVVGDNREPTFWQGVLLAKAGRIDEARTKLAHAHATNDEWPEFLRRLPASGLLPDDASLLDRLLG